MEKTKELVKLAHDHGMSIEAEVGAIGGEEDGVVGAGECADPMECKAIADLGVDMLAAGIGNIHGIYPENWQGLSFETLDAVQQQTGAMPLVLHGGTGIPDDMIDLSALPGMLNSFMVISALLPAILTIIANIILRFYPIDNTMRAQMQKDLAERRNEQ